MNANSIAGRTLTRLNQCDGYSHNHDMIDRLCRFLADPANIGTERYRRLTELLETARQRKEGAENDRRE